MPVFPVSVLYRHRYAVFAAVVVVIAIMSSINIDPVSSFIRVHSAVFVICLCFVCGCALHYYIDLRLKASGAKRHRVLNAVAFSVLLSFAVLILTALLSKHQAMTSRLSDEFILSRWFRVVPVVVVFVYVATTGLLLTISGRSGGHTSQRGDNYKERMDKATVGNGE